MRTSKCASTLTMPSRSTRLPSARPSGSAVSCPPPSTRTRAPIARKWPTMYSCRWWISSSESPSVRTSPQSQMPTWRGSIVSPMLAASFASAARIAAGAAAAPRRPPLRATPMSWRHADQCNLGWLPIPLCHWHKVVPKATVINFETWSCRNSRYYTELGNIPNVHGSPMRNRPMGENSLLPQ